MILLIDNYDSFTYNLAQLIGQSTELMIVRNDDPSLMTCAAQADGIVISPGPGTPEETGEVKTVIQHFYKQTPILGICLGHQTIGQTFGEQVTQAQQIYHGKASTVIQKNSRLFAGLADSFSVIRYHSLVITPTAGLKEFIVTARSKEDQEIMAIEHKKYPLFGIQFHPESIGTTNGDKMIQNFIALCGGEKYERAI